MKYPELNFNIVLVEPQIPNNTGNIGRTCVATHSMLHLIEPLGFDISDKRVKRSGLDYWPELEKAVYPDFESWYNSVPDKSRVFFFSARAEKSFYKVQLQQGDYFVFGREADGLPETIKEQFKEQLVKIPFPGKVRSFNLSNAVAMSLGEGLRQINL
ncbi:MAG: tRNA (cytidine(34)-2'-O)-methyltransferase [Schleiferiaceae bacterium]|jgi:tRNA (cytidine/uridine-2'-O-)-methyltransferase|nr:tRNA (cytidine(34)-2'-O)-methyltransferase [Schleiferiaceae bacterium]